MPGSHYERTRKMAQQHPPVDDSVGMPGNRQDASVRRDIGRARHLDSAEEDSQNQPKVPEDGLLSTRHGEEMLTQHLTRRVSERNASLVSRQEEDPMPIAQSMLPEFDHEMANARVCLSRIPADKLDWKAHEKSYDLRGLATHIANLPKWTVMTLDESSFDMEPEGEEPITEEPIESVEGALEMFDASVAAAREVHRQRQ